MELAIKINQETREVTCASCGKNMLVRRGPALYEAGSDHLVCQNCGETKATHLAALLDLSDAAEQYIRTGEYTTTDP